MNNDTFEHEHIWEAYDGPESDFKEAWLCRECFTTVNENPEMGAKAFRN